ncbi:sulfite exporter TauE/SafE family protein [Lentilactobacillus sp. IMAU92037]|uniref:sulfite exporter TauE/SafE family protein n=1 Tax=Lentilactobacillus TaxID=2767893 RepID=UPI001C25297E|nr:MULTISPECIES: sulfite exporter TauE/SafE family protein [Lentilactobacillus]MBU9788808.1 sulfite exporter TauE/SafE family protein [Lentilactobacillus dabitei]MBV0931314.1 sulfite exporter TauE/SafE family protein [Lentilactobacillus dabitei]MDM7517394.1 sulfite exporter TauE/SafE family protein [Lentilactobacillus sp. TOM.63]
MTTLLFVLLPAVLAGIVQGVTGFGSAIVLMVFLPTILPIPQSAGVASLIMSVSNIMLAWRYRRSLSFKRIIWPFLVYASVAFVALKLVSSIDVHLLKSMLGGLLVALSLYFLLIKSGGRKHYPIYVAIIFMVVSGFFNGLFGIGGPLMALYFLSLADTKEAYLAYIQTFFLIDQLYVTSVRFYDGILGTNDIPFILIGIVGGVVGTMIANRITAHMNIQMIQKCVFVLIGISGLFYLVQ